EHDAGTDVPDVEAIAKQVVGGSRNHGTLPRVKRGRGQGDDHDEDDAHNPGWQLFQEQEKGDGTALVSGVVQGAAPGCDQTSGPNQCQDDENGHGSDANPDVQILVRFRRKGAQPERGEEEVVRQDGNGQDVQELPAQETRICKAGCRYASRVNMHLHANGDGSHDEEKSD